MVAFGDAVAALGAALGVSTAEAGYILGLLLVVTVTIVFALLTQTLSMSLVAVSVGTVVAVVLGWWPYWAALLVGIALVAAVVFARGE